jgi:signal transduction protein with GAF and PtsI domain
MTINTTPTKELSTLKEQEAKMLAATNGITIKTQDDYDNVVALGKKVSAYIKSIDTKEKAITKPINDSLKQIRDLFRPFKETAEAKKSEIKTVLAAFLHEQEQARKREEERIAARVEKGTLKESTAVNKLATLEEQATVTSGTTTSVLRVKLVDIKAVPAEYLILDEAKVKAAYRSGVIVPGVKCEYETAIRL